MTQRWGGTEAVEVEERHVQLKDELGTYEAHSNNARLSLDGRQLTQTLIVMSTAAAEAKRDQIKGWLADTVDYLQVSPNVLKMISCVGAPARSRTSEVSCRLIPMPHPKWATRL